MKKLLLLGMTIGTLMIFSACSGESGMGKITSAKEWQSKHTPAIWKTVRCWKPPMGGLFPLTILKSTLI